MLKKQRKIHTFIHYSFTALLCVTLSHCLFHYYEKTRIKKFWSEVSIDSTGKEKGRFPSSQLLMEESPEVIQLLNPYFRFESFDQYLDYDFHIDTMIVLNSKKNESSTLLEELSSTLILDRIKHRMSPTQIATFQFSDLMEEILFDFDENKIPNGAFEVNFNFIPKLNNDPSKFKVLHSREDSWSDLREDKIDLKNKDLSLIEKIKETRFPDNEEPFQYVGGQITLYYEVKDLNDSLENEVIRSKQRFITGQIRYRKYFMAHHFTDSQLSHLYFSGNSKTKIDKMSYLNSSNQAPFSTTDIIQEFNPQIPNGRIKKAIFHFGQLRNDPIISHKNHSRILGELKFNGSYKLKGHPFQFDSTINSLHFDFLNGQFTRDSEINISILSKTSTIRQRAQLQNEIKNQFLEDLGLELIQKLKLGKIQHFFSQKSESIGVEL